MNFLVIANNYEGNEDAIGKHARILNEEYRKLGYNTMVFSGRTSGKSKIGKIFSMGMTIAFFKAAMTLNREKYDYAIIEYPFDEYNPLILISLCFLKFMTLCNGVKIALSLHEFDRVKFLRKVTILVFVAICDILFVSEDKYLNKFRNFKKYIFIRKIPNHLKRPSYPKVYDKKKYVYFGLVSSTKAIKEMITAWNIFNKENKYSLDFITSSDVTPWYSDNNHNIFFHHNLPDDKCAELMYNAAYAIIPVKPFIGNNNSSFISASQCGCIPIGVFSDELSNLKFVCNIHDYSIENLTTAFQYVNDISIDKYYEISSAAIDYGSNYTSEKTAEQMIIGLKHSKIK